jgi:glucose-6-phosphate isomerase
MFKFNIENCFTERLVGKEIGKEKYYDYLSKARNALNIIKQQYHDGLPIFNIPSKKDDLLEIKRVAKLIREKFTNVIVFATGGSSLNGKTLTSLIGEGKCNIIYCNNIDPVSFDKLIASIDLAETAFLIISKSGYTPETLAQSLAIIDIFKNKHPSNNIGDHLFVITSPTNNSLRQVATKLNATILIHDNVGGRFSTFTSVALLPAAIAGLNIEEFRTGGNNMLLKHFDNSIEFAVHSAAVKLALLDESYNINVVMAYIDCLKDFNIWYRQIWAESLGKNNKGSTLIDAMGTIDQHSQLQLYLDGPKDKLITLITINSQNQGAVIRSDLEIGEESNYILGKTLGDLMNAEAEATKISLINNHVPLITIELPKLDENVLGGLMMYATLETIITAHITSVNPYDQPAVEDSKIMAKKLLEKA